MNKTIPTPPLLKRPLPEFGEGLGVGLNVPNNISWLYILPLLLLVTWLGARELNTLPFWQDERWSIYHAGGGFYGPPSFQTTWTRVAVEDPWQAPGYYLLLAGWGALTGWTEFATRVLSLLLGVLGVAWVYRLGHDLAGRDVGLFAAAILASSAFMEHYLSEARTYTLLVMLVSMTLWAYWRIVHGDDSSGRDISRPYMILFVAGMVGMLYIHYFAGLTAIGIGLYHLLFVPKNRRWWHGAILIALSGVIFLPWLAVTLVGVQSAAADVARQAKAMTPPEVFYTLADAFSNGSLPLLGILILYGLGVRGRGAGLVAFVSLVVLGLSLAINAYTPFIHRIRYLMALWPLLAVLAGMAIQQASRRGMKPVLPILAVWMAVGLWQGINGEFIYNFIGRSYFRWDVLVDELRAQGQPGDKFVYYLPDGLDAYPPDEVATYYFHELPIEHRIVESLPDETDAEFERVLDFIEDSPRLWLSYEADRRPGYALDDFEEYLAEHYLHCADVTTPVENLRLALYTPVTDEPPAYEFGGGVGLLPVTVPEPVNGSLPLTLRWSVDASVPANTYSVAVHVLDAAGNLAAQTDYGLPPAPVGCVTSSLDVSSLAPGEYALAVIVYNWGTGERLLSESGDRVTVGRFEIK
jgi:hypothetical protein